MQHYLVRLSLLMDEYDKHTVDVVLAASAKDAMRDALMGECHNECDMQADGRSCYDGGEFFYKVLSCRPIPAGVAALVGMLITDHIPDEDTLTEQMDVVSQHMLTNKD